MTDKNPHQYSVIEVSRRIKEGLCGSGDYPANLPVILI